MTVNVLLMASISQMNCRGALKLKVCRLGWTWSISMSSCAALLTWSKQRNIICRQRNCIVALFKFFFLSQFLLQTRVSFSVASRLNRCAEGE